MKISIIIDPNDIGKCVGIKEEDLEYLHRCKNRHGIANAFFRLAMDLGIEFEDTKN